MNLVISRIYTFRSSFENCPYWCIQRRSDTWDYIWDYRDIVDELSDNETTDKKNK